MQKRVAFCLTAAVLLLFLGGCRQGRDSGSHLVVVDAKAVPVAAGRTADSGGASAASSAVSPDDFRTGTGGAAGGNARAANAVGEEKSSGSSRTAGNVSSGSSGAGTPAPGSGGSSAASSAGGSGGPSSSAGSGQPSAPRSPTLADGVDAVNAAFALADAQPVAFRFTDTLEGNSPQTGTVCYNNRPSAPVFTQNERLTGTSGVTETAVCCRDGATVTGTSSSGGCWTRPLAADDVTRYVRLLTPRLSAGSLSDAVVQRQADGSLTLQGEDADGKYGPAAVMAGLPDAGVTAVRVSYAVRADGCLGASTQSFTLRTDSGTRVFTMEKQYQW